MIKIDIKKQLNSSHGKMLLDVNLNIEKQSFVSIFGQSGAGKTTILRILTGLDEPDSGRIVVNNEIWYDSENKINLAVQKRGIGFVFQDYSLFNNMSVKRNIEFAAGKNFDQGFINRLLEISGLKQLENQKPGKLSGGQKQRLALVRAVARKPDILLLDEPLSALDKKTRLYLQDEILKIHSEFKITSILVSHDISEVFKLAGTVYVLENGCIVEQGKPGEIWIENKISGKYKFSGELLDKSKDDFMTILTVLIGNNVIRVVSTDKEAENFEIGDTLIVSSKAFNPIIFKKNE